MSRNRPKDRLALLQIKGVGQSKLDKYGEMFLQSIQNFQESATQSDSEKT